MATDKLKIYNGALLYCGHRSLASLSDNVEARRLLDQVWDDGGVKNCLEQGQWKFAMCGAQFFNDTSVSPSWGYRFGFKKPDDWVVTSAIASDAYFRVPLMQYEDAQGYWWSDYPNFYCRYVSDAPTYGMDFAKWPASFTEFVKAYFAGRIIEKLSQDEKRLELLTHPRSGIIERNKLTALNKDAMAAPPQYPAQGRWSRARQGGRYRGRFGDGGSSGSLIG